MFWADEIVEKIEKTFPDRKNFIVRDEKTPSGRVHIGSLRGVVIHGIIAQALKEKGLKARYFFLMLPRAQDKYYWRGYF